MYLNDQHRIETEADSNRWISVSLRPWTGALISVKHTEIKAKPIGKRPAASASIPLYSPRPLTLELQ